MSQVLQISDYKPKKVLKLNLNVDDPIWNEFCALNVDGLFAAFRRRYHKEIKACFGVTSEEMDEFDVGSLWLVQFKAKFSISFEEYEIKLEIKMD